MIFTDKIDCFRKIIIKHVYSGLKNPIFNLNLKLELKLSIISFNNILNDIKNKKKYYNLVF